MTNPTYFTGINRTNSMIDTEKKNQTLASFATGLSYPIVDLFSLYKSVLLGNLITNDGIKVDGKWPGGNFFSSDGIHPSAFGQAVITNEIIKVMNTFYKTDIPYISTRDFLK
jgi:lysophospholipase L1-like esterase